MRQEELTPQIQLCFVLAMNNVTSYFERQVFIEVLGHMIAYKDQEKQILEAFKTRLLMEEAKLTNEEVL